MLLEYMYQLEDKGGVCLTAVGGRREHLYEIIRNHPLKRKVLLMPSHAQGHILLEQVSREFGPVLNMEVKTLDLWALERVNLLLTQKRLRYITNLEARWISCRLLQSEIASGDGYLNGMTISPGVTDVFHQALMELRSAGVKAETLSVGAFENEDKGRFVKGLLHRYEEELERGKLTDLAGLLVWVKQLPPISLDIIIVVDEDAIRTELDRQLVDALTGGGRFIPLVKDPSFIDLDSRFPLKHTEIFHASAVLAEVREVFRRITEMSIPWDQVELVLSNDEHYAGAVNTVASGAGIRCTYSGGLPIGLTNAGKSAKLLLDWIESGYNIEYLLLAIKQSYIRLKEQETDVDITSFRLVREAERTGIGWGRDRYQLLENRVAAEAANRKTFNSVQILNSFFQHLFTLVSEEALSSPRAILRVLIEFVDRYAVLKDEGEHQVLNGIRTLEQAIAAAGELNMDKALTLQYVRDGLEGLRIHVSGTPSPGYIHVTPLSTGGQSGRPYTFIVGMSEKNWMVSARQDPVLLDEERARIHSRLITSVGRTGRLIEQRSRRLGMIRGKCFLSYCSYDTAEGHEQLPAYEMLQIYRMKNGQPSADYETMVHNLEPGVSYTGIGSRIAMDTTDSWMRALLSDGSQIKDGSEAVYSNYPHIFGGVIASRARADAALSPYDGLLDLSAYPVERPGEAAHQAFSASKLEMYARCPLQYFFHEILHVRKKDTTVHDRTKWLNALQRGSLMHDIFNKYLTEMKEWRASTSDPLTEARLNHLTEQVIQQYKEQIPAPSEHIFHKECDSIRKDVNIFFVNELKRTTIPAHMELQLHEQESPMRLELEGGLSLPVRGFVDRVDEIEPHQYKIFDYKTGNPRKFKQNECFSGGTKLQLPLYGMAVEQWMRQSGYDVEARVTDSVYYFPTEKGMGEEISRPQHRRKDLSILVEAMLEAMKQGLYPPTNDPKNCTWCDYKDVCGVHAEQFADKRGMREHSEKLGSILEVERFD